MLFSRRNVVLAALLGAALLMLSTTMTWVEASGLPETAVAQAIQISGSEAANTVAAMGLVGLAAAVAVTIAGRIGRWIIAALLLGASAMALYTSVGALIDPAGAAAPVVGEASGTTAAAQDYQVELGVWTALVGAVLMLVAALVLLSVSHRWTDRRATKKYSRAGAEQQAEPDELDLWDGLSQGQDPTEGRAQP